MVAQVSDRSERGSGDPEGIGMLNELFGGRPVTWPQFGYLVTMPDEEFRERYNKLRDASAPCRTPATERDRSQETASFRKRLLRFALN
jgi:hypothetical protein